MLPSGHCRPQTITETGPLPSFQAVISTTPVFPASPVEQFPATLTMGPLRLQVMTCQANAPRPVAVPTMPRTKLAMVMPPILRHYLLTPTDSNSATQCEVPVQMRITRICNPASTAVPPGCHVPLHRVGWPTSQARSEGRVGIRLVANLRPSQIAHQRLDG